MKVNVNWNVVAVSESNSFTQVTDFFPSTQTPFTKLENVEHASNEEI